MALFGLGVSGLPACWTQPFGADNTLFPPPPDGGAQGGAGAGGGSPRALAGHSSGGGGGVRAPPFPMTCAEWHVQRRDIPHLLAHMTVPQLGAIRLHPAIGLQPQRVDAAADADVARAEMAAQLGQALASLEGRIIKARVRAAVLDWFSECVLPHARRSFLRLGAARVALQPGSPWEARNKKMEEMWADTSRHQGVALAVLVPQWPSEHPHAWSAQQIDALHGRDEVLAIWPEAPAPAFSIPDAPHLPARVVTARDVRTALLKDDPPEPHAAAGIGRVRDLIAAMAEERRDLDAAVNEVARDAALEMRFKTLQFGQNFRTLPPRHLFGGLPETAPQHDLMEQASKTLIDLALTPAIKQGAFYPAPAHTMDVLRTLPEAWDGRLEAWVQQNCARAGHTPEIPQGAQPLLRPLLAMAAARRKDPDLRTDALFVQGSPGFDGVTSSLLFFARACVPPGLDWVRRLCTGTAGGRSAGPRGYVWDCSSLLSMDPVGNSLSAVLKALYNDVSDEPQARVARAAAACFLEALESGQPQLFNRGTLMNVESILTTEQQLKADLAVQTLTAVSSEAFWTWRNHYVPPSPPFSEQSQLDAVEDLMPKKWSRVGVDLKDTDPPLRRVVYS